MTSTKSPFSILVLTYLIAVLPIAAMQQAHRDVNGTWSGSFQSKHRDMSPFTMTIVIAPDSHGELVGTASLASDCFEDSVLHVTVEGSKVVIAGSDSQGDSITFRGSLDSSGTVLKMRYILNSSASARCESDEGEGSIGKR
jgi:hypothetical protein